ncbi:hypothetical protein [Halomonas getboli]|uniref:hypothetical protein n=1 Tax=Halomonas getboli TaxID=2935862 RepID=UPI001FFE7D34|nr:hypothetical protein [Halomonas getboli]MCK2185685.1 hypothetical protein [Halomonas getboli]
MSSRTLNQPSDLFDAIRDRLLEEILNIDVDDYNEFGSREVGAAGQAGEILIEFERVPGLPRNHAGQFGFEAAITLHCVVGRQRHRAPLEAINLAAAVQRVATDCVWGLPPTQIEAPEGLRSEPSFFKDGAGGYEAWGVSFTQCFWIGPELVEEDPVTTALPQIAWNIDDSLNTDDESVYEPLP